MKINAKAVVCSLGLFLAASQAAEARNGIYFKGAGNGVMSAFSSGMGGNDLIYRGGPVLGKVKVYAVFWGSNVDPQTVQDIGAFYASMADSTLMDFLKQYNTPKQKIEHGTFAGGIVIKPKNTSTKLTDDDIGAELTSQLSAGNLPAADADALYMLYFPAGMSIDLFGYKSCQDFCAYHSNTSHDVAYGVMPDVNHDGCQTGCGDNSVTFDNTTEVSSHEFIEAVTDPLPMSNGAWQSRDGQEIGDLCVADPMKLNGSKRTYIIQKEYDNATSACTPGPFTGP